MKMVDFRLLLQRFYNFKSVKLVVYHRLVIEVTIGALRNCQEIRLQLEYEIYIANMASYLGKSQQLLRCQIWFAIRIQKSPSNAKEISYEHLRNSSRVNHS